jgi:hypothetical protein
MEQIDILRHAIEVLEWIEGAIARERRRGESE